MKVMPTFSIIMPVYNSCKFLHESIGSVLGQAESDWEMICIDDGSTDGSPVLLDEYAMCDDRIRVFHKKNEGVGVARNLGLTKVRGEWVCWLDSDDMWNAGTLTELKFLIRNHPNCQLLKFNYVDFSNEEELSFKDDNLEHGEVDVSNELTIRECMPNMWQFAYKKSAFGDVVLRPFRYGEDRIYLAECMLRARAYAYSDRPCCAYRQNPQSITHRALSLCEFQSFVDHNVFLCSIYQKGPKALSRSAVRYLILFWTEFTVGMIGLIQNRADRTKAWRYWASHLATFAQLGVMSQWQQFVLRTCHVFPGRICGWTLCYLPHWLKLKGLHR